MKKYNFFIICFVFSFLGCNNFQTITSTEELSYNQKINSIVENAEILIKQNDILSSLNTNTVARSTAINASNSIVLSL